MNAIVVIPARYRSTRLPGKVLLNETGKYLIQHVYEQALKARLPREVVIATDDDRVLTAATEFGARAALTGTQHRSGTERVAEVAAGMDTDIVVNLQGDEPTIDPALIDRLIEVLDKDLSVQVATAAYRITDEKSAADPNLVKVVLDSSGNALYFSRSPVPYYRDAESERSYLAHIGIYAYRRDFLLELTRMEQTKLEAAEKLEQLRILENGHSIRAIITDEVSSGIDTKEDYDRFVAQWKKRNPQ